MKLYLLCLGGIAATLLFTGCQTIDDRIAEYPALYQSLDAEEQRNIREGLIDLGYTKDMVYLALGSPDIRGARVSEEGRSETWTYQGVRLADVDYAFAPAFHRHSAYYYKGRYILVPRYQHAFEPVVRERYDKIIVEFRNGRVVAINFPAGDIRLAPESSPSGPLPKA